MAANPDLLADGLKLLARCHKAAGAYGRPDLAERVEHLFDRVSDDAYRVMVVGEFKHGKSSLVNALLGETITPVDADIATSAPIVVRYGVEPAGEAILAGDKGVEHRPFPLPELNQWATEGGNPDNRKHVRRVEVSLPHPILEAGVAFVDTPGVGGLASTHGTITAGALPMADAVIFVSDAAQELSANEVEFLKLVLRICPHVAYVITKVDLHHNWKRIAELDLGHLERLGLKLPVFAVSSVLRDLANEEEDDEVADRFAAESGFRPLVKWIGREVASRGRKRSVTLISAEIDDVVGQLAARFEAEQAAVAAADPAALLADLGAAKTRAESLKGSASKWSGLMSDGFGDLQSDVDHDLRLRMRDVTRKMEELLDASDPADCWAEFEPWLYREAGAAVTANYAMLCERVDGLVERVCELFGEAPESAEFVARVSAADAIVAGASVETRLDAQKATVVAQGLSVLRGGYSSVGMFSMYAGMAGVVLTNPVSAALALVMGRKGLKDERERQLGQRRAQAKAAGRRYLDEVNFIVGKDSRDTMRHLQRDLREYFGGRAEQAVRSATEAASAAQTMLKESETERQSRLADVEAELARLAKLRDASAVLAAAGGDE